MRRQLLLLVTVTMLASGCASVVNDSTHPMRVETVTASGEEIRGAECRLTNSYGTSSCKSGETAAVRRSSEDMDIVCTYPGMPTATGRAISRANGGMFGNILLGGGIGAIVDHNKGTAYTYPTWVKLVYGKTLVFDRRDEKEGFATPGREGTEAQASSDGQTNLLSSSPPASVSQPTQNAAEPSPSRPAAVPPATAGPAPIPVSGRDEVTQLQKLKELHDKGLITDEEYEKKRKEILSRM